MVVDRLKYFEINGKAIDRLTAVNNQIASIDEKLKALIEIRISQINGCVYCVDMHSQQARDAGETQQRLDCLVAWQECPFFDEQERAVLAWAEAVTLVADTHAPDDIYENLCTHFSEQQVVDLTLIVSLMNAWNRLAISFRHLPESR